jgi:hypothetical protein
LNAVFAQRVVVPPASAGSWLPSPQPGVHRQRLNRDGDEITVLQGLFGDEQGEHPACTWVRSPRWSRHTPITGSECALICVKGGKLGPRCRFPRGCSPEAVEDGGSYTKPSATELLG